MRVIVVMRMHCSHRTQIVMTAQMCAPRSTGHDKRAYEQDESKNPEHGLPITDKGAWRNGDALPFVTPPVLLWANQIHPRTTSRRIHKRLGH